MKKKTLTIVSSCAAIAVCSSLIVGSTYALFSSEDKVDIAITAGKVAVTATVEEDSLETYSMGVAQAAGSFENGGTAGFSGKTLNLLGVTPGDSATFNIKIKNESTVNVIYRVNFDNPYGDVIVAKADGITVGNWNVWYVSDEIKEKTVTVSVEIPAEYEDIYGTDSIQGETMALGFAVEAYQGNAQVDGLTRIANEEELLSAIASANPGDVVMLTEDIEMNNVVNLKSGVTLDGNGHTLTVTPENKYGIQTNKTTGAIVKNLTVVKGGSWGSAVTTGVDYDNCTFVGGSLYITPKADIAHSVTNCTFISSELQFESYTFAPAITVKDNTFELKDGETGISLGVGLPEYMSDIEISGNTFKLAEGQEGSATGYNLISYNDRVATKEAFPEFPDNVLDENVIVRHNHRTDAAQAIVTAINDGAKTSNEKLASDEVCGKEGVIFFDEKLEYLSGNVLAVTLHFAEGSEDFNLILNAIHTVTGLIGEAVSLNEENIYSVQIGTADLRTRDDEEEWLTDVTGAWVESDLMGLVLEAIDDINEKVEKGEITVPSQDYVYYYALLQVMEPGVDVVITDINKEAQTYRMNFDVEYLKDLVGIN